MRGLREKDCIDLSARQQSQSPNSPPEELNNFMDANLSLEIQRDDIPLMDPPSALAGSHFKSGTSPPDAAAANVSSAWRSAVWSTSKSRSGN